MDPLDKIRQLEANNQALGDQVAIEVTRRQEAERLLATGLEERARKFVEAEQGELKARVERYEEVLEKVANSKSKYAKLAKDALV